MRLIYTLVWWMALPMVLLRLWYRGKQEPGYRQHIAERLGYYKQTAKASYLWVHAVSAGETRAAEPLIRALLTDYPQHRILLTHMTPTGRATGASLFADCALRITQVYLPYDIPRMLAGLLKQFSPRICILIETEVWPNLVAICQQQRIPVALVNARLSEKSLRKAMKMQVLILPAAQALSTVAAQTPSDALRLQQLGIAQPLVTGNMKFDVHPPADMVEKGAVLRSSLPSQPVFLWASTREGEEELLLDALIAADLPPMTVILTPRHPQRFDQVARLLESKGLRYLRRTEVQPGCAITSDIRVILGDSMGEMYMYYAACDLAFIGGSLLPFGGHNLIEACAMSKPVLIGSHTFNFSEITENAITADAAIRVSSAADMMQTAKALLATPQRQQHISAQAHAFFMQHQGATARTVQILKPYLQ